MVRFRLLTIASGYEDGNDATSLRQDPVFKMAQGIAPRPALSPRNRRSRGWRTWPMCAPLLRMASAMVDLY